MTSSTPRILQGLPSDFNKTFLDNITNPYFRKKDLPTAETMQEIAEIFNALDILREKFKTLKPLPSESELKEYGARLQIACEEKRSDFFNIINNFVTTGDLKQFEMDLKLFAPQVVDAKTQEVQQKFHHQWQTEVGKRINEIHTELNDKYGIDDERQRKIFEIATTWIDYSKKIVNDVDKKSFEESSKSFIEQLDKIKSETISKAETKKEEKSQSEADAKYAVIYIKQWLEVMWPQIKPNRSIFGNTLNTIKKDTTQTTSYVEKLELFKSFADKKRTKNSIAGLKPAEQKKLENTTKYSETDKQLMRREFSYALTLPSKEVVTRLMLMTHESYRHAIDIRVSIASKKGAEPHRIKRPGQKG